MTRAGLACLMALMLGTVIEGQSFNKQDEAALQRLPQAFSAAFNKRDAHALAMIMSEDVDFVTVGLTWLHGLADFEKYHARLIADRFNDISVTVLKTHVRFMRPDIAVVRYSWSVAGDRNVDGSARPQRFGMTTMIAEKRRDAWAVTQAQNVNSPTGAAARTPEADDIRSPIVVPRAPKE